MPVVIGVDEAGYAPNLGPLVIGATMWHVEETRGASMEDRLSAMTSLLETGAECSGRPIRFADSKRLFNRAIGAASLEPAVLALLECCDQRNPGCADAAELLACCSGLAREEIAGLPGYRWSDVPWPVGGSMDDTREDAVALQKILAASGIRTLDAQACCLFAGVWNDGVDRCGNKATFLSAESCGLIRRMLDRLDEVLPDCSTVEICCDKHGGRNHYAALVQESLADGPVAVVRESRAVSVYQWRDSRKRKFRIRFSVDGERIGAIAAASMLAKYLRELAMLAWNDFWKVHVPDVQPTAGYPLDARRFRDDIAHAILQLEIPARSIWRMK